MIINELLKFGLRRAKGSQVMILTTDVSDEH